jgi:tryptophanase
LSGSNAVESNSDKGLLDLNEIEKVLTDPRADDVKVIIKVILKNKIVNIVF